ncbi:STAS domain-containing protein [Stieleria varia]|uniref:STAS domain protein n=1 Tax=Stieleria varia TaxID=2528005 RepID=A0A5C5ZL04_9BACT|nr:STAS domain-containing protein [Stieleria varia]TWT87870.1 STAS domain protein [Stieleria varia]
MRDFNLLRVRYRDDAPVISFEISDFNRVPSAQHIGLEIEAAIEDCGGEHLILDLQHAAWLSSAALNQLIRLRRRARESGVALVLAGVQHTVRQIFVITRLDRQFSIDETAVEAKLTQAEAI